MPVKIKFTFYNMLSTKLCNTVTIPALCECSMKYCDICNDNRQRYKWQMWMSQNMKLFENQSPFT